MRIASVVAVLLTFLATQSLADVDDIESQLSFNENESNYTELPAVGGRPTCDHPRVLLTLGRVIMRDNAVVTAAVMGFRVSPPRDVTTINAAFPPNGVTCAASIEVAHASNTNPLGVNVKRFEYTVQMTDDGKRFVVNPCDRYGCRVPVQIAPGAIASPSGQAPPFPKKESMLDVIDRLLGETGFAGRKMHCMRIAVITSVSQRSQRLCKANSTDPVWDIDAFAADCGVDKLSVLAGVEAGLAFVDDELKMHSRTEVCDRIHTLMEESRLKGVMRTDDPPQLARGDPPLREAIHQVARTIFGDYTCNAIIATRAVLDRARDMCKSVDVAEAISKQDSAVADRCLGYPSKYITPAVVAGKELMAVGPNRPLDKLCADVERLIQTNH